MKVKSKLMEALSSIKDQSKILSRSTNIITDIDAAVLRATDHHDTPIDDNDLHELLFLVSNAPGSISVLARRVSVRLRTARDPIVPLKALLLLHRLLRGGDRYFEQDLRNLFSSGELQMDLPKLSKNNDPLCRFILEYSRFIEERIGWFINQSGNLEPVLSPQMFEEGVELILYRISKCQMFLDRVSGCSVDSISPSSRTGRTAMSIVVRESFRVYESFKDGVDDVVRSLVDLENPRARGFALNILRKACNQTTPNLHEFYENCRRGVVGKSMDYPSVEMIASAHMISSMEELSLISTHGEDKLPRTRNEGTSKESELEDVYEASVVRFAPRMETKVSTVWVEFDDGEEDSQKSGYGFRVSDEDLGNQGES